MMVNFRPVQTTQWDHVSNKTQRQSNVLKPVSVHRQRNRESEEGHVGQIPKSPPIQESYSQRGLLCPEDDRVVYQNLTEVPIVSLAPLPHCPSLKKLREMNPDVLKYNISASATCLLLSFCLISPREANLLALCVCLL